MKKSNKKVVIAGAGPIGCYLARLLKKRGIKSLLLEEHSELGRPVHCAGVVGRKVFDRAQIPLAKKTIINKINKAELNLGSQKMILKRNSVAYVIDREAFDRQMGKGLDIRFNRKFIGLEKKNKKYLVETDKESFEADIVVGADGANSSVRRFVYQEESFKNLIGIQFRIKLELPQQDIVRVYLKKPYFYWIIPEKRGFIRVGGITENAYQDIINFIKEKKIKGKVVEKFAGIVPLTHFFPLSKDGIFLVGDSASQIKPLTYGGLYMGMRAAEILADCIIRGKPGQYGSLWRKKFGREISLALRARQILQNLSDEDVKKIFNFVKKRVKLIEEKGDFENHSLLLKEFLKDPYISKDILSIFFKIMKAGFNFS